MRRKTLIMAAGLIFGLSFAGPGIQAQTSSPAASPGLTAQLPCPLAGTTESSSALCVSAVIRPGAAGQGSAAYGAYPLNVGIGTTVIWVNEDTVPHTVTADDGSFNSGTINPGQDYAFTFNTAGTFTYHDSIYGAQSMYGSVVVSSTPPTSPPSGPPTYGTNCSQPAFPYPNFPYPVPPGPPHPGPSVMPGAPSPTPVPSFTPMPSGTPPGPSQSP